MRTQELQDWLDENLEDEALTIDGCDRAIIGVTDGLVVYSRALLDAAFILQGMTEEEAMEWVDYNVVGAYVGPMTPVIIEDRNLPIDSLT
jgi:hypothetical protein